MERIKRLGAWLIIFCSIITFLPTISVQAAVISDIDILSQSEITLEQAKKWAESKNATDTFVSLAKIYSENYEEHGDVNPWIAYVQAAKETGYGHFGGVLDESYHNPCGLKTSAGGSDSDPNAHTKFKSWEEGVQAHLDHLALYAGAEGYPRDNTFDQRHFVTIKGKAKTVNSLGAKWAPSATYGEEVNKLYKDLLQFSGLAKEDDDTKDKNNSDTEEQKNNTKQEDNTDIKEKNDDESQKDTQDIVMKKQEDTVAPNGISVNQPIKISQDSSVNISSNIGWKNEGGKWYYYRSNGTKANGWIKPDNSWYYLFSDGEMATGWNYVGSKWYYFRNNGTMQLGWLKSGSTWYYLQGDGSMTTGFNQIDGSKYFFDVSGCMRVSWFYINNQWYYFDANGAMVTGWIKPGNSWYYMFENGIMATGWLCKDGNWYYLNGDGEMITGWFRYGNSYYYFYPSSGKMAGGEVIDGWPIAPTGERMEKIDSGSGSATIVIDAGHNFGGDDGAYATHQGTTYSERDLNMQVANKLRNNLSSKGYNVIMTREDGDREYLSARESLAKRVAVANDANADFFISIHHNSASVSSAYGIETYYSSNTSDPSKVSVSRSVASEINNAMVSKVGGYNRGTKDSNLYVCRHTNMPSVLVEVGFISNPDEAKRCASSANQELIATAIADSIANNF